jgi:hypothetical protein
MRAPLRRSTILGGGLATALAAGSGTSQPALAAPTTEQQRLDELKAMKHDMVHAMRQYESRIAKLEAAVKDERAAAERAADQARAASAAAARQVAMQSNAAVPPPPPNWIPPQHYGFLDPESWGRYEPGKGFVLTRSSVGEVSMSLIAYARYLNQTQLDRSYTDSFGRTKELDLRQDIQWNKVNLSFKGWLFDPNFTYRAWVWTQQPAMGEGAQVVVGGQMGYRFADYFNLYAGIAPLPTTRSTNWTYPFWLKMDNRTVADEFFRGSYSQGIWADGEIVKGLNYRAMVANNLSALGIAASQLDAQINTLSGAIWWMPTTGEFGPSIGFGDYEGHEQPATLFGVHFTRSREDKQSQAGVNDIDNSQIRLSDGTLLFSPNAFGTDGQVNRATYEMADLEAGLKYLGWSLEGEYYLRWISDFRTTGFVPVSSLFDQGFQVQASAMVIPKKLQVYVAGSQVFGQYGDPWDLSVGLNWFPFSRREMHVNAQAIYLEHSPVGGLSYPYIVGGNGWVFNTDVIVTF